MHRAKEGDREGYREAVREREGKREQDGESREIHTILRGSINGPSSRKMVGLIPKLDELMWPSITFEVIFM